MCSYTFLCDAVTAAISYLISCSYPWNIQPHWNDLLNHMPFEGLFFQHANSQLWHLHNTFCNIFWFTEHFDLFKVLLRCTMSEDKSCQLLLNSFSTFYVCNVTCSAHIQEAIIRLVCELRPFELNGIWVQALPGPMHLGLRTDPMCCMFCY
jgi:hypothetical protein